MKSTIMLIAIAGLGSVVLEMLAREESLERINVCDINKQRGITHCNLVRVGTIA